MDSLTGKTTVTSVVRLNEQAIVVQTEILYSKTLCCVCMYFCLCACMFIFLPVETDKEEYVRITPETKEV